MYELVVGKNGPKLTESAADTKPSAKIEGAPTKRMTETKVSMAVLASQLIRFAGRPVLDKTSLTGDYDLTLEWTPEGTSADMATAPSLFTAVQEQLGLKLQPSKASMEILVIDHVAKPSSN